MKRVFSRSRWTWSLVTLSCLGLLMGQLPAWAFAPAESSQSPVPHARPATPITDVTLDKTGAFIGQVVDGQGQSRDGVLVVLRQGHRELARTMTDARGHFVMPGIPAGLYQLDAGTTRAIYRVWTAESAPPQARQLAVLVAETDLVVRAQTIESAVDQLDVITLLMVASSVGALIVAAVALDHIDDLEDRIDAACPPGAPASP